MFYVKKILTVAKRTLNFTLITYVIELKYAYS